MGHRPHLDAVICTLPHEMYRYTGDLSYIERYYPAMRKYIEYLTSTTEVISAGLAWGIGARPLRPKFAPP